ncbi:MAG: DUF2993 domain-containing protein [Acidobacteria bacterium]|nr:DUF2993 domain-containing protein [Acidobacteriota bacterium]
MTDAAPGRSSAPRKRRTRPFVVIASVLVVLIVGFFVADAAAKAYAGSQIKAKLVAAMGLPASTEVTVDFGSGPILFQALSGSLSFVDIRVPKLAFGALVGAADIRATGVPLDTSQPLETLTVSYAVTATNLEALAGNLSNLKVDSIAMRSPEVVATASLPLFGIAVPVGLGLTPSVSAGKLDFTPTTIDVAGQTFTSQQLQASPVFGSLATTLLQQQSLCIAQYLPKALTARSAHVVGSTLVLTFTGNGAVLGGSAFTTKGSCS